MSEDLLRHVPGPPDWRVDWTAIRDAFDWADALHSCPQDATWHAEGDVGIHTGMVLEALAAMSAWRALDAMSRTEVFLAALLHDVAKPGCTRTEDDGRITSRGHSLQGAVDARRLLWELGLDPALRERVCALIRQHQVPFYLIDKDNPRWEAIRLSWQLSCRHLALVAEADARGRTCADQQRLLDNIELFRETCREDGILDHPFPYPDPYSRLASLQNSKRPPELLDYTLPSFTVVMMSGMPASGKDWYLREACPELPVVSLDAIRRELGIDPAGNQGRVRQEGQERCRRFLRAGTDFAFNATNLSRDRRGPWIDLFLAYEARVEIVYVETPHAELVERNRNRPHPVPLPVIEKMLRRWEVPLAEEAHRVVYPWGVIG